MTHTADVLFDLSSTVVSRTVCCPLEAVKLVQQLRHAPTPQGSSFYSRIDGDFSLLVWIPEHLGIGALWRGNLASVIRLIPQTAINVTTNGFLRKAIGATSRSDSFWKALLQAITREMAMTTMTLLLVYPLDLARTRLAMDVGPQMQFDGILDCIMQIAQNEGVFALYKGLLITLLGSALHRATYLILSDRLDVYLPNRTKELQAIVSPTISLLAGAITYPLDTVRRYRMMDSGYPRGTAPAFASDSDCFVKVVNQQGVAALFGGLVPYLLRGILASVTAAVYQAL